MNFFVSLKLTRKDPVSSWHLRTDFDGAVSESKTVVCSDLCRDDRRKNAKAFVRPSAALVRSWWVGALGPVSTKLASFISVIFP